MNQAWTDLPGYGCLQTQPCFKVTQIGRCSSALLVRCTYNLVGGDWPEARQRVPPAVLWGQPWCSQMHLGRVRCVPGEYWLAMCWGSGGWRLPTEISGRGATQKLPCNEQRCVQDWVSGAVDAEVLTNRE